MNGAEPVRRRGVWWLLGRLLAVAASLFCGLFFAFNVVFTDIFGFWEHVGAVFFVFAGYALMGVIFGFLGPRTGVGWAWWLAPAGLVLVITSLFDNAARSVFVAGVMLAVVSGSAVGAWLGSLAGRFFARGYRRPS